MVFALLFTELDKCPEKDRFLYDSGYVLEESFVTTARRVLRLGIEETASSCRG
jgi:hypothetical protein